jgi:hypothetical protein
LIGLTTPLPMARLAAACLALVMAAGAIALVGVPLYGVVIGSESQAETRAALDRYLAIAADRPRLEQALAALPAAPGIDTAQFAEPSDALALAALQNRVAALAAAAAVDLVSAEVVAPPAGNPRRQLTLTVQLSGKLAGLQRVIHGIEGARPLLFITRCDIDRAADSGDPSDPSLTARVTIAGYRAARS